MPRAPSPEARSRLSGQRGRTPRERSAGGGLAPLLAVCCGYFMVILDVTIVNVAAPAIGRELAASLTDLLWIVDGYTIAFAGLLLLGGALGDRWGHRRVFCLGVAVFTVASLGCVVAGDVITLTVFRLVEGCGAALLVPGSLALLQQVYVTPAARARAFGLWGAIAGVAATAGPVVGGVLTTTVGWRWVFAINLPIGLLCLVLTMATVRPSLPDRGRIVDWLGQTAVVVTVAAFIAALNEVGRQGNGGQAVIGGFLVAAVAGAILVLRERFGSNPPLPRTMLGSRPLAGGTAIGFLFNFGFYGMIFAASVYFQQHQNLSAAVAGLALLPAVAVTMVASALSGRLSARFPHRRLMFIGLMTAGIGLALWAVVGDAPSYAVLVVAMVGLRLRHVLHPHGGDLHGHGGRPHWVCRNGVGGTQHGPANGIGCRGRDQRVTHRGGRAGHRRPDVHGRRFGRVHPRRRAHPGLCSHTSAVTA